MRVALLRSRSSTALLNTSVQHGFVAARMSGGVLSFLSSNSRAMDSSPSAPIRRPEERQLVHSSLGPVRAEFSETAVGICSYANGAPGFKGILKQRYLDFIVREIDSSGKVATLVGEPGSSVDEVEAAAFPPVQRANVSEETLNGLQSWLLDTLGEEHLLLRTEVAVPVSPRNLDWGLLRSFMNLASSEDASCPSQLIVCKCAAKEKRTALHNYLKQNFQGIIESDSIEVDGTQSVRIKPVFQVKKQGGRAAGGGRGRSQWPSGVGSFLRFVLAKENCDTALAMSSLAKYFRCNDDSIKYAGTKDKRGVTFQYVTIFRKKPSEVNFINRFVYRPLLRIGNYKFVGEELSLGDLSGNQFEIILREVDASPEALELACAALSESGFINYYGLQRFGMGGTVNHAVGSAVLKGEWKSVLEMVFKPKPGEKSEITKVKELFLAGDYRNALDNCPRFLPSERAILEHLNRSEYNRRDYSGAVNAVPRGTRLLWMHAYQSYVWNRAASHRIASFGLRVVIGDLVSLNAEGETNKRTDCATASHSNHGNMDGGLRGDDFQRIENLDNDLIHVVTADDIAQNKFSFTDVILPLPGYDVSLPRHATGEFYESLLHEDGLTLSHFRDQVPPQFRTRGTYRRVIQRAHNFTWKIISYLEPDDELATTEFSSAAAAPSRKRPRDSDAVDLDSLSSAPITPSSPAAPPQGEGGSHASRRALALRFSLPPGAYATMLLRELTKQSMETEVHSAMSATSEPVSTKLDGAVE